MHPAAVTDIAVHRGGRVFQWIQDIYPEILTAHLGALVTLPLAPLRTLRDVAWRSASCCVTLGEDMRQQVADRGVPAANISVIPNWAPRELHTPAAPEAVAAPVTTVASAAKSPAVEPTPVAKPAEKSASVKPVEKAVASAKPVEKPAAKAETKPAAGESGGQWVVQLGAYKESGNVKLLLSKLKGVNVPAYTEKFDSPQGQRTRVRAGPFPSQEAAEKARSRIKIIGVDGPVAPK